MSLYNALFGVNDTAPILLAVLGLKPDAVGRFRDAYIEGEHIVIHTRNGGGNRECWHRDDPQWGAPDCEGEAYEVEVDEIAFVTEAEATEKGYALTNIFAGNKRGAKTGHKVMVPRHTCTAPDSDKCGCPGCVINYRLPKHPNYVRDEDDDYDCTYANIYFSFPAQHAEALRNLSAVVGEPTKPAEKWESFLAAVRAGDPSA